MKWRRGTENINPKVSSTSDGKGMILSKCAYVVVKKLDLLKIKKQKDY